ALVRDLRPTWTATQVINQVLNTGDPVASMNGITVTGRRLNAFNAVRGLKPCLTVSGVTVTEGNFGEVQANFTVRLASATDETVSGGSAAADGTARPAARDYVAASGELRLHPGVVSGTVTVRVNGDQRTEPDEDFFVNFSNPVNAIFCGSSQARGVILND